MKKYLTLIIIIIALINISFSLNCASELQSKSGTCINQLYNLLYAGGQAYYSCNPTITGLWYYQTCTATVATGTIFSDNNNIVAEWWSNDANKVSACLGHDGLTCNVNPTFNFQTDQLLSYVGYCDSSEQTCVKCSSQNTEILRFDGSGTLKANINGAGNGLCEKGCQASTECDEQAIGYNIGNGGCTNNCGWQNCNNYNWNSLTNLCYTSCQTNNECYDTAICDLVIDPNTCKVDPENPQYHQYFHTDLTPTPDDSIITGDIIKVSAYWTDNLYLSHADLEIMTSGEWRSYAAIENINSPQAWTNYTINTSQVSEDYINWRITMTDVSGNTNTTPLQSFYVYSKSAKFNITLNLLSDNKFLFTGWGQIENNLKADNSINSTLIGDIILTHDGRGINSKYSFKLNESLPPSIRIKINNESNPLTATILNTTFQFPTWCQSQIREDTCQVWMWMDLDYGNTPQDYFKSLVINHESN